MLENTDRKLLWLWLDVAFGPADKRLWDVMSYYDSVEEMCDACRWKHCSCYGLWARI